MPDRVRLQTSAGNDQWDDVSTSNPIPVSVVTEGEAGGLVLEAFSLSEMDTDGATQYIGYLNTTGEWYIKKLTDTQVRYATGSVNFSTNWANRAALTYQTFDQVF